MPLSREENHRICDLLDARIEPVLDECIAASGVDAGLFNSVLAGFLIKTGVGIALNLGIDSAELEQMLVEIVRKTVRERATS